MGIRWIVGATNGKKREEPQDNADYRGGNGARNEGGSGGGGGNGGSSGGTQNNGGSGSGGNQNNGNYGGNGGMQNNGNSGGGGGGTQGAMYPPRYYPALPPQQVQVHPAPNMGGGGAMSVGYYANGYAGDMPSMYGNGPQNSQMGFITEEMFEEPESRHRSRRTGRFVRGEGGDEMMNHSGRRHRERDEDMEHGWAEERGERGEDEVRELKKKIRKLEEKLEDADSSREVKRLKSRIEELEEKLEEGMKREKRGGEKKKKSGGEDEEEDGEDDPAKLLEKLLGTKEVSGKEFLKELPRLFREAVEVIKNPPPTWPPYIQKGDYAGIVGMESKELMQALEGFKAGQKKLKDVGKELKHTCAALIQLECHRLHEEN